MGSRKSFIKALRPSEPWQMYSYDEETEEYSEDVAILTGKIADLTKTAATPGGISLFEADDPTTYRSTYDILSDIAAIWDDLEDRSQRAPLLEALFGKQRAQVGAAILSNWESAAESIEVMEGSAGSAMEEFENVEKTLTHKLNALKETWVGIAQDMINSDFLKGGVDLLTKLSAGVGAVMDLLGPLGTLMTVVFGRTLVQSVGRPKVTGFNAVPTYALAVTRNERAA